MCHTLWRLLLFSAYRSAFSICRGDRPVPRRDLSPYSLRATSRGGGGAVSTHRTGRPVLRKGYVSISVRILHRRCRRTCPLNEYVARFSVLRNLWGLRRRFSKQWFRVVLQWPSSWLRCIFLSRPPRSQDQDVMVTASRAGATCQIQTHRSCSNCSVQV